MRWRGVLAACAAALGLVVVAPTVAFAQSQLLVGAGTADITPPPFDLAHDEPEFAANCPNLSSYTGKRFFKFEEPYIDQNLNERSPDTVGIYGGPENPAVPVGDRTGIDEYYMHKWLIPQAVSAGVKAYDDLQPATLWARQTLAPSDITVRTHTFPTEDDKG